MLMRGHAVSPAALNVFDADAQRIFSSFMTPPDGSRQKIINDAVTSLKSAGNIWGDLDLAYSSAAADSQAARINWKNPGVKTLVDIGGGPAFVADRGFTGNGSSTALDTGWTPSIDAVKFAQNDASIWWWSLTDVASNSNDIGNLNVDPSARGIARTTGDQISARLNNAGANFVSVANTSSIGLFGVQRRGASDLRIFKNGVQLATDTDASTGLPTVPMWICGAYNTQYSARQIAFAAFGASLAGKELDFYNIIHAYMQAVGAA
jgi:hypothetical protein